MALAGAAAFAESAYSRHAVAPVRCPHYHPVLWFGSSQPVERRVSQATLWCAMTRRSMCGHWSGAYSYDPTADSPCGLPSVRFTLDVEEEWEEQFRGAVQDDPEAGSPEQGRVRGRVAGDRVEFVKRIPVLYLIEAGRARPLEQCVREWWGRELARPVPAPPIHYEGTLSPDGNEISGRWWIEKTAVAIPSGGEQYALDLPGATGSWSARRSGDPPFAADRRPASDPA